MSNTESKTINPKVSIITPVFNTEKYIAEAIESVQKQNFKDYEHIIIDDGSTDDTVSIIKRYLNKDTKIKLIIQKNSGAASARNRGLKAAKGDYITFIDGDDFVAEDMLNTLFERASKYSCDLISYNKYIFNNNERKSAKETWLYKTESLPEVFCPRRDLGSLTFLFAPLSICVFLERKFVEVNKLTFDSKYRRNEDVLFMGKAMALSNIASIIRKELYYYRVGNKENLSSTLDKFMDDGWMVLKDLHEFLVDQNLLQKHVEQSFYALCSAILWHYISNMKTYKAQKYAFNKTKELARKLSLQKMKDPGDIYTSINFYTEMRNILNGGYDEYLWNSNQRQNDYIANLISTVNNLDDRLNETDKLLNYKMQNSHRQQERQEALRGSPKYHLINFPYSLKVYMKNRIR